MNRHSLRLFMLPGLTLVLVMHVVFAGEADKNLRPITATGGMIPVYAVEGRCAGLSPDGTLLVVENETEDGAALYEIITGTHRAAVTGKYIGFSDVNTLITENYATGTVRVYDIHGALRFEVSGDYRGVNTDHAWLVIKTALPDTLTLVDLRTGTSHLSAPGSLWRFSPDSRWLAVKLQESPLISVYDAVSAALTFEVAGEFWQFSPDSRWLVVGGDGVYAAATGEKLMAIQGGSFGSLAFSPDSSLLAVGGDGLYEMDSAEKRRVIEGGKFSYLLFSPDGTRLAVGSDGLYEMSVGTKVMPLDSSTFAFTADSLTLVISHTVNKQATIAVYEAADGRLRFEAPGDKFAFSPDETLLMVEKSFPVITTTAYEIASGISRLEVTGNSWRFSPDGRLFASSDGLYVTDTGEKIAPLEGHPRTFDPASTTLAATMGSVCVVYGSAETNWQVVAPRAGMVYMDGKINVRRRPDAGIISGEEGYMLVVARNAAGTWYKIPLWYGYAERYGWISARVVTPVYLPEDLPVENP